MNQAEREREWERGKDRKNEAKKWWEKIKRSMKLKCLYLLRQYLENSSSNFPSSTVTRRCSESYFDVVTTFSAAKFNGQMIFKINASKAMCLKMSVWVVQIFQAQSHVTHAQQTSQRERQRRKLFCQLT